MTQQTAQALLCGGTIMLMFVMVLTAIVYKIQIDPINRRRKR